MPATPPTDAPVTGGSWASGPGNTQTSGAPVDYAEYRQWMTIDYTRNPKRTTPVSDTIYRSLAQLSATDVNNIAETRLHFNVTVHNSCTILSGNYNLSASYQAQKFAVMANKTDKVGYTYGEVSGASSLYVFGPVGSIVTTQPYIRRNIKTAADVPYHLTQQGTTDGFAVSGDNDPNVWGVGDDIGRPYEEYLDKYYDIMGGTDFPYSDIEVAAADIFRMMGGAYTTSAEPGFENNSAGIKNLQTFIEANCACLRATVYNWRFCVPVPTNSNGSGGIVAADRLAINPYYNTAFHDYT